MTVSVQWDQDPAETGLPDTGEDTKQYPDTATSGTVTVTSEQDPTNTATVNFQLPLDTGPAATVSPDKTSVDAGGDAAARTITSTGTGFAANASGRLSLMNTASPPAEVVGADFTTNAQGAMPSTPLVVPSGQAAGTYNLTTSGAAGVATAVEITVTAAATPAITADKTTVDSGGTEADRTVAISGTGFPASGTGTVAINTGAPGSGGTEVVSAPITTDAQGAFPSTNVIVPADTPAGPHHIIATVGAGVSDDTALEITLAATPTVTPDKTSVDPGGDAAARTISSTGAGFVANAAGRLSLMTQEATPVEVVGADFTTDAAGEFAATTLVVPSGQTAGTYDLTTSGAAGVATPVEITVMAAIDAPANLAEGTVTQTTIPLAWDPVTTPVAAESYVVRHAPTGTTTWTERAAVNTEADTIDGLTANSGYDIQVKAQAANHTDSDWAPVPALTVTTSA